MNILYIPLEPARRELVVVNSRFIASLAPAFSVEQARHFIQSIRAEFPDATHHIPVYLIGSGNSFNAHSSDDGEPAGTAGRPALAVLQGSGLGDVVVVITRYFGGTKLGTGGLVRAYTEATQLVVAAVSRGIRVPSDLVMTVYPYSLHDRIMRIAASYRAAIVDTDFSADVTLTCYLPSASTPAFSTEIFELSHGKITPLILESLVRILPIPPE